LVRTIDHKGAIHERDEVETFAETRFAAAVVTMAP
jgi:hypothetical protein